SRSVLVGALALFALASPVGAVPITMDFTAAPDRPLGGSSTVTGTFWYDLASPGFMPGGLFSGAGGTGGSLTFGGQTDQFPQWPGMRFPGDPASVFHAIFEMDSNNRGNGDVFQFLGFNGVTASGASTDVRKTIKLQDPGARAFPSTPMMNLPTLNLADF